MKILWYVTVVIDIILLITSFLYHNFYLTILSFIIALILNKFQKILFSNKDI